MKPITADDKLTGADVFATSSTQQGSKDGKDHPYGSLVEMVRTVGGPRQSAAVLLEGVERIRAGTVAEKRGGIP